MSAITLAWLAAAAIAMASAIFGATLARIVWADDLHHAQKLRVSWDQQRAIMEETIKLKDSTMKTQEQTIQIYKKRLGE